MTGPIQSMVSIIVILAMTLAASCIVLAAFGVFARTFRVTAGRLTLVCLVISLCAILFVVLFLPGQRHRTLRLERWWNRSTALVREYDAAGLHRDAQRLHATAAVEAARFEDSFDDLSVDVDDEASDVEAAPQSTLIESSHPRVIVVTPPDPFTPPETPEYSFNWRHPARAPRLLASAVSTAILAGFLFIGYLFLDSGTRGQFTWTLRIGALLTFVVAWVSVAWWLR